jgi:hypothetical protein
MPSAGDGERLNATFFHGKKFAEAWPAVGELKKSQRWRLKSKIFAFWAKIFTAMRLKREDE